MKTNTLMILLGASLAASPSLPAVELLKNGSFDDTSAWTVVPPEETWTCIGKGEAFLHPYPSGYVGVVIKQPLAADLSKSRKVKLSAVMTKIGAPSGSTIRFVVQFRDQNGKTKESALLTPDNDSITSLTPLAKTVTLPAEAKEITGFSVNKLTNGMFTLQSISLDLVGVSAQPDITVQQPVGSNLTDGSAKKSFGTVVVGKTGTAKTFTVGNSGFADLKNLAITKDGANAADFTVGVPAKTTLKPGEKTTFKVTFKPKAKGVRNAAVHLKSNDADENPFDIKLAGAGG